MKRVSMLAIVMVLVAGVCGSALAQTGEESREKAGKEPPVMSRIESDEDLARVIAMMRDKVAALEKTRSEDSADQAVETALSQYPPLLMRLGAVTDKEKRESLRQSLVKQIVTLQRLGAVRREPELLGRFSRADVKRRIYEILTGPPVSFGAFATITEDGTPWVRFVQIIPDEDLNIRIGTSKNSRKVSQIKKNPEVHVCFYDQSSKGEIEYVQIQGEAEVSEDPELKKSIWNPFWWLYWTGPEDSNYVVVIVRPYRAELWDMADLKKEVKPVAVWTP